MKNKGIVANVALLLGMVTVVLSVGCVFAGAAEIDDIKNEINNKGAKWKAHTTKIHKMDKNQRKNRAGLLTQELGSAAPATGLSANATGQIDASNLLSAPSGGIDWRDNGGSNYVTPVKDQGDCGSCWAFAASAALESYTLRNGTYSNFLNLSEQTMLSCSGAGSCGGGYINKASDFAHLTGLPGEAVAAYTATDAACSTINPAWKNSTDKIVSWQWVAYGAADAGTLRNAVFTYGPIVVSMKVYSDFYAYDSGVYSYTSGGYYGGHAVTIVGYNDDAAYSGGGYFIVKNSWGTGWGEPFGNDPGGYFRIAYSETTGTTKFGANAIAYNTAAPASCTYAFSSHNITASPFANAGTLGVITAMDTCAWTVKSDSTWLPIVINSSGKGSTTIYYNVAALTGAVPRTATLTMSDPSGNIVSTATVTQNPATTPFVPPKVNFSAPAYSNSLNIPVSYSTVTGSSPIINSQITTTATPSGTWGYGTPTSFAVKAPGVVTLYAWAKDYGNIVSAPATATVTVEMTPPVVTGFSLGNIAASTISITTFTATDDNSGIGGYQVTNSLVTPTTWSNTPITSYTATTSGSITLYAWAKDKAGNISSPKMATVTVDGSKPVISAVTVGTPFASYPSGGLDSSVVLPVTIAATDNTGVTGYLVTASTTVPALSNAAWATTPKTSIVFAPYTVVSGSQTLYAWAKDASGNVSVKFTFSAVIDCAAPTVATFTLPATYNGFVIPITSLVASDNIAVSGYYFSQNTTRPLGTDIKWLTTMPTTYAATATGLNFVYLWVKDSAGNISISPKMSYTNVSNILPTVTSFTTGLQPKPYSIAIMTFTANVVVSGYLVTTTATTPLASNTGWSATAPTSYSFPIGTSSGSKTLYAWVKNAAGNVSPAFVKTITLDNAAPVMSSFVVPQYSKSLNIPITQFTATDNIGVTGYIVTLEYTTPSATDPRWSATAPAYYTAPPGLMASFYGWVKDAAGNVSLSRLAITFTDTVAPTAAFFQIPATVKGLTIPISFLIAYDDFSGLAGYMVTESAVAPTVTDSRWSAPKPVSYITTKVGAKNLYIWLKDVAGNVSAGKMAPTVVSL